eukprot:COSAG03_NODE_2809_length_2435_cov_150.669089_4_plen_63_part_00
MRSCFTDGKTAERDRGTDREWDRQADRERAAAGEWGRVAEGGERERGREGMLGGSLILNRNG